MSVHLPHCTHLHHQVCGGGTEGMEGGGMTEGVCVGAEGGTEGVCVGAEGGTEGVCVGVEGGMTEGV